MHTFLYSHWVALPLPTRQSIAFILNIPKTGPTHVQDNRIVADGYPLEEVERALDPKNIQQKLGVKESDPAVLWALLIKGATPVLVVKAVPPAPEVVEKSQTVEESNAKPEKIKVVKSSAEKPAKKVSKKPKK